MANTNWNTRIVLCNDTSVNWSTSEKVLLKGEVAIELTDKEPKIKIGDGVNTFAKLKYATMTPEEINNVVQQAIQTASHSHANKDILDAITASFTTELKENYDKAYTHANSAHAPSNAERNTIATIKKNGDVVEPDESRAVDITVPIKTSELTNDSGFVTKTHTHGNADITDLDASKLTGTIDIARLPHGALERCKVVADDTARFKLTKADVQTGDTVKVTGTGKMYFVIDDSKLSTEAGYEIYTAGSATSVPWSGVTGKPSVFPPSAHTQDIGTINGLQVALDSKAANKDMTGATSEANGTHGLVPAPTAGSQGKYLRGDGTWQTPPDTKYNNATGSSSGLMSPTDKTKLDGIAPNANNYVHPTTPGNKHIPSGGSAGQFLKWTADGTAVWAYDNDTKYGIATTSTAGLVKSAGGLNQVAVASSGIMSVNSLSTDKLVAGSNVIILNGGGAV